MKRGTAVIILAVVAIIALFYWPTFRWLFNSWTVGGIFNQDNPYSYGLLVPLISGFFIWMQHDQMKNAKPSFAGFPVLAAGVSMYIVGSFWDIRFLIAISFLIVVVALVLLFLGIQAARANMFSLGFLIFMIPMPFTTNLIYDLQHISVRYSSRLLDLLGLPITSSGPDIHLKDATFTVGLSCSGINTLFSLLALAAIYAHMLKGAIYKRAFLLLLAFPLAIIANILRITSVILVAYYYDVHTATGWYHDDVSTPVFFFLAVLMVILAAWILRCRINYDLLRKQ